MSRRAGRHLPQQQREPLNSYNRNAITMSERERERMFELDLICKVFALQEDSFTFHFSGERIILRKNPFSLLTSLHSIFCILKVPFWILSSPRIASSLYHFHFSKLLLTRSVLVFYKVKVQHFCVCCSTTPAHRKWNEIEFERVLLVVQIDLEEGNGKVFKLYMRDVFFPVSCPGKRAEEWK